jgi:hypothetical protein
LHLFHSLRDPAAGTLLKVRFKVTDIRQIVSAPFASNALHSKSPIAAAGLICVKALELKGYKAK